MEWKCSRIESFFVFLKLLLRAIGMQKFATAYKSLAFMLKDS